VHHAQQGWQLPWAGGGGCLTPVSFVQYVKPTELPQNAVFVIGRPNNAVRVFTPPRLRLTLATDLFADYVCVYH
jgi:hypothetical protein